VGHVTNIEEVRNVYKISDSNQNGEDHLEDLGTDGRILLQDVLERTNHIRSFQYELCARVCMRAHARVLVHLHCHKCVFTETLPSNGNLF
jgi:hypothetical protein